MYFKCSVPGCTRLLDSSAEHTRHVEEYHCEDCGHHADPEEDCKRCPSKELLDRTHEITSEG